MKIFRHLTFFSNFPQLSDLEKNLDLERVRNGELMAALERESDEAKTLTLTLDQERQQTREEIAKQVRAKREFRRI